MSSPRCPRVARADFRIQNPYTLGNVQVGRKAAAAGALLGAVVVGVMGNAAWELLVRPGVTRLGRLIAHVMTLGSMALRNAPYASAALDPTPLPALAGYMLLTSFPLGVATAIVLRGYAHYLFRHRQKKLGATDVHRESERRVSNHTLFALAATMVVGLTAVSSISYSIVDRAVLIWRVFNTDMRICAPFLTPGETAMLQSTFARMTTEADYEKVHAILEAKAKAHNVSLSNVSVSKP